MKSVRGLGLAGIISPFLLGVQGADRPLADGIYAEITTPRGVITCELFFRKAPLTVANFVGLAEGTLGPAPRKPFFNGLTFHRVVPGFVIQGGDPLGTGEGGPGYNFPDEFVPGLRHDAAGILSMANSGPDTNGSQFFLTLAPVNRLNYLHSVFGRAIGGLNLLTEIKPGDTMSVKILRRGADAESFRADEKNFATLAAAQPRAVPPAFDDPAGLLPSDPPRAKILNAKLENFRRATGVHLYVRLYEKFEPEFPGETAAAFVDTLGKSLPLGTGGVLAAWFADKNRWEIFAPGRPEMKLAAAAANPSSAGQPPAAAEQRGADEKKLLLSNVNEVIDGLIVQLETKPAAGNFRSSAPVFSPSPGSCFPTTIATNSENLPPAAAAPNICAPFASNPSILCTL